jgi:hypothetical protein
MKPYWTWKKVIVKHAPYQKIGSLPTAADIKTLLGVVINMGLRPMSDIKDYRNFSQAWVNKMPLFSDVFWKDEFWSSWNLHFELAFLFYYVPRDLMYGNIRE